MSIGQIGIGATDTMAADGRPDISLLLCTLGRTAPLLRALTHLAAQTSGAFEVVLVDQNAPGHLDAIIRQFETAVRLVHVRSAPGLSRARNAGLAVCRGPIIGFPDDDCWYLPPLVADVAARFAAHPDWAVLMGRTLDANGCESLGRFLACDQVIDKRNLWFAGNSNTLFVRAEAARVVGGFDETLGVGAPTAFKSGEETDFVLRILNTNAKAMFQHDLVVHHDQVGDNAGAAGLRRAKAYAPGFGRVLRLHRYGFRYVASRLLRTLAGGALALGRGDLGALRYKLHWARGTLAGYRAPLG